MKIYIETDLEGISGVDSIEMMNTDTQSYRFAVKRLMADTNAAIEGAFLGGAKQVTVIDGHGGGGNFDLSLLDKRAVVGGNVDDSYDAIFCIGAHAMAGTQNAFLDHTQSSLAWFNYWINGRRVGELVMSAALAGHFGVPLVMVAGDEAACAEARLFFDDIECAAVKYARSRNEAVLYDLDESIEKIKVAARNAMSLIGSARVFRPILPMEVKLELCRADYCDPLASLPGVERLDARTVRKVSKDCSSYKQLIFV